LSRQEPTSPILRPRIKVWWKTRGRKAHGSGGNTTPCGRTARWTTRRPRSSAPPARRGDYINLLSNANLSISAFPVTYSHNTWTKKREQTRTDHPCRHDEFEGRSPATAGCDGPER